MTQLALKGKTRRRTAELVRPYIRIARLDHWFKNLLMLPGLALAIALGGTIPESYWYTFPFGVLGVCLIASANYTINEWLDAKYDRHHPTKHKRPSAIGQIKPYLAIAQWIVLASLGLWLSFLVGNRFLICSGALLFMGVIYNVEPIRTKDRLYLDVLTESLNNALRFLLGWYLIEAPILPPSSVTFSYWMGGAFLMAVKRYAEYRFIGDPQRAGLYRKSFKLYSERTLLLSAFFYALLSALFLGVFLVKYKIEFILALPLFAILFVWYLHLGLQNDSVAQSPEKMFRQPLYLSFVVVVGVVAITLFFVDIPEIAFLLEARRR